MHRRIVVLVTEQLADDRQAEAGAGADARVGVTQVVNAINISFRPGRAECLRSRPCRFRHADR
jgi:hypothetical protein